MSRTGVESKPRWSDVPRPVQEAVSRALGQRVARAMRVWGGYGPTPSFRARLANGGRVFLKGCSPASNDRMREGFHRELRVYRELQKQIREWAPAVYAHTAHDGWEILVLEDLGPRTVPPWSRGLARSILHSFAAFHAAGRGVRVPTWVGPPADHRERDAPWSWTRDRDEIVRRVAAARRRVAEATRWLAQAGPALASASRRLEDGGTPPQLLHGDPRSDNLRVKDGRLRLYDWAEITAGPPELDVAFFAQSIAVESGLSPESLLLWYQEAGPLDPVRLDAAVCAAAGFFADQAWRPAIPGLPRLREFQRRQLVVSLRWAARRLALEPPRWLAAFEGGPPGPGPGPRSPE